MRHRSSYLISLDPANIFLFNRLIQRFCEEERTILMSSHNLNNIKETCSRVLFLKDGKIVRDASTETSDNLEEIYLDLYLDKSVIL